MICIFLHHKFQVHPEATLCLKYFADIKNSLTCFYLYWNESRSECREGHLLVLHLQTILFLFYLRFCRMFYSTCSSGAAGLIRICHKVVVTLLLSLVSAVNCWYWAGRKAPSCYTSDGTLWRSMKTELGSGVSLSLWDLLVEGWMLEGAPGALKLC